MKILKRTQGTNFFISDMGLTVPASSQVEIDPSQFVYLTQSGDVLSAIAAGELIYNDGSKDLSLSEAFFHIAGFSQRFSVTEDGRQLQAGNRIPPGYTVYPTGQGDAISANGYGQGVEIKMDANNKIKTVQFLEHFYAIGGRAIWEGSDLSDSMKASLIAPATSHAVQEPGAFNKVEVVPSSGLNVFVPAAPGAGAWNLDLTAKHAGTNVLKCVPVPVPGNTGFFDYDSENNTLSIRADQMGGYNLYDFEANLFRFAHSVWGRKQDGAESMLDIPDVVGKLIYNVWQIRFELVTQKTSGIGIGGVLIIGAKKNL